MMTGRGDELHDALQGLDSIEAGHFDIQGDDIGLQGDDFFQSLCSSLKAVAPTRSPASDSIMRVMASAHEGAVVGHQDANSGNWQTLGFISFDKCCDQAMHFLHVGFQFEGEARPVEGL